MSKEFFGGFRNLFAPDVPRWACELTDTHVVAVGVSRDRRQVISKTALPLAPGALFPDLKTANIADSTAVQSALGSALEQGKFSGSDIVLVIPDDAVRISLLSVDSFPSGTAERTSFIKWKLKKSVPFEIDSARVAFQTLGENGTIDLLIAISPRSVAEQYEAVVDSLGLHAGVVTPSTVATFNLLPTTAGDVMFVKGNSNSITTSVLVNGRVRFYRKVPIQELYEAIYPTLMYYQDRLGGEQLREIIVCGDTLDAEEQKAVGVKLALPIRRLESEDLEDAYKPAFGALQP